MSSRTEPCSASGLPKAVRDIGALAHQFQRALGAADQAHAVMDAAGAEPALRDLEAAALAEQDVLGRHADILVDDLGMADRRVVVAVGQQSRTMRTPGVVLRHQDHGLLAMAVGIVGRGLAHHDQDLAILGFIAPDVNHLRPLMT